MKKRFSKFYLSVLTFFTCSSLLFSQNNPSNSGGNITQIQPTVIVVPLKVEGEKYRSKIEDPATGFNVRTAINVVDNAFKARQFITSDFVGIMEGEAMKTQMSNGTQVDELDLLVKTSGADIYVTVDINVVKSSSGNEVSLFLVARDAFTGAKLSTSKPGMSGKFYTEDIFKLTIKALENIKEDFLNELQNSFTKIVAEGRSISIDFVLSSTSKINFGQEVGTNGDLLSEALSDWLTENAYKGYAQPGADLPQLVSYKDVRIPLKNPKNNANYQIKDFTRELRNFFKKLNIPTVEPPKIIGSKVTYTIN